MAIVAVLFFTWRPLAIRYWLRHYRSADAQFSRARPQLCDLGPRAREPTLQAFVEHGAQEDVAAFRVAVFQTLRCLRHDELERSAAAPVDAEALRAMVAAFAQEPSEPLRAQMLPSLEDLDPPTRYAVFAGMLGSARSLPRAAVIPEVPPVSSATWCRELAPALRRALEEPKDVFENPAARQSAVEALLSARCDPAQDLRAIAALIVRLDRAFLDEPRHCADTTRECFDQYFAFYDKRPLPAPMHLLSTLEEHLSRHPDQAKPILETLLALPTSCPWSHKLYLDLRRGRHVDTKLPPIPEDLSAAALALLHRLTTECHAQPCEEGEDLLACERQIVQGMIRLDAPSE